MLGPLFVLGHLVLVGLASYIIYIAFVSYRRYDDPVLGMICLGFVFIGLGTAGEGLLEHVLAMPVLYVEAVEIVANVVGFGWIVLAIRG